MATTYGYDKNTDYQKLINQDLANQDYQSAAIHEAQRNEKIQGEGVTGYKTTSHYTDYLPKSGNPNGRYDSQGLKQNYGYGYDKTTDYQKLIDQAVANHDYRSAGIYEAQRNAKIRGEGLYQYTPTNNFSGWLPKDQQIDAGLADLDSRKFDYNMNSDPVWQSYRKQYLREADRQTRDTMAAYAGQTLGMPSTAAVAAAQQAGNYQRAKLADKVPELYQNAYGRYLDDMSNARQNIDLQARIEQQREQTSLQRQEAQGAARQQAMQNAMDRWKTMGVADEYVEAVLGIPAGTQTSDYAATQFNQNMQERQQTEEERHTSWQERITEAEMADQREQQKIENALSIWDKEGTANDYVASVLGVEPGTPTTDASYQAWQMQRDEQQQERQNAMDIWQEQGTANDYVASVLGVEPGTPTTDYTYLLWQMANGDRQADNAEQQQERQNAMDIWDREGTANAYVASVLGVPEGTPSTDYTYLLWQMANGDRQADNAEHQQEIQNALAIWDQQGTANAYVASVLGVPEGTESTDYTFTLWQMTIGNRQQDLAERQQDNAEQQQQQQQADADRDYAAQIVTWMIEHGQTPSDEMLQAAGMTREEAQAMAQRVAAQMAAGGAGGGGSSGGGRSGGGRSSGGGRTSGGDQQEEETPKPRTQAEIYADLSSDGQTAIDLWTSGSYMYGADGGSLSTFIYNYYLAHPGQADHDIPLLEEYYGILLH